MLLALQALPLLVLLGLLWSGRASPVAACLAALGAALPAAALSAPTGLGALLATELPRALFLAAQPVAVMAGGLLFHAAVSDRDGEAGTVAASPRRIYAATLLGGAFVESVTGFGVGAVVAVAALGRMGLGGAPAGALALLSLWSAPWGGLGPGSALGAALVGVPAPALSAATALPHALWLLTLPAVGWRLCGALGIAVPPRERLAQMGFQGAAAALLLLPPALPGTAIPWEASGIVAAGAPLLLALYRLDPPRGAAGWRRAAAALAPWVVLTAALLLARSWRAAPGWAPFAELPPLPLNHVAVVLWAVSLALLAMRSDGPARLRRALGRAGRPARTMLAYVLLGRLLAASGAAAGLARAAAGALGGGARFALSPIGMAGGMITGSNVGSNAALMPVQVVMGTAAGLPAALAAGLHNSAGAGGAAMALSNAALVCALLGDGTRPEALLRRLWPAMLSLLLAGWATVLLLG